MPPCRPAGQLAEHDGYFALYVLAQLAVRHELAEGAAYPGLAAETTLAGLQSAQRQLERPPDGWDTATYMRWRDGFGATKGCWNDNNFGAGGDMRSSMEFVAGPLVSLEAAAPSGRPIADAEIEAVVSDMLATMFHERNPATHPAATEEAHPVAPRQLDCNGIEVQIRESVRLSGRTVQQRVDGLSAPLGSQRGAALCRVLCGAGGAC